MRENVTKIKLQEYPNFERGFTYVLSIIFIKIFSIFKTHNTKLRFGNRFSETSCGVVCFQNERDSNKYNG